MLRGNSTQFPVEFHGFCQVSVQRILQSERSGSRLDRRYRSRGTYEATPYRDDYAVIEWLRLGGNPSHGSPHVS
jgi:hypothetical protein